MQQQPSAAPQSQTRQEETPVSLGGTIYNDSNRNGNRDNSPDEVGVSGIIVQAKSCLDNHAIANCLSLSDGKFRLPDIGPPGCYYLEFVEDEAYTFTRPKNGRTEEIVLESGQADFSWDAGVLPRVNVTSSSSVPTASPSGMPSKVST